MSGDISELTLLVLRLGFLAVLWLFIFAIVYALRSDLFGQRVRKLAESNPNQFPEPGRPADAASPFADPTQSGQTERGTPATPSAPSAPIPFGQGPGSQQPAPISSLSGPGTPGAPGAANAMATVNTASRLVITSGPKAGTAILLGREPLTIGRSNDSGLVVRDDFTSTHHARLLLWNDEWMLQDLDSTNGTFLGEARVTVPTRVPLDTTVKIGTTTFELRR